MTKKILVSLFIILLIILIAIYISTTPFKEYTDTQNELPKNTILKVTLEIKAPFSYGRVVINENSIIYETRDRSKLETTENIESKKTKQEDFTKLVQKLNNAKFWEMKEEYIDNNIMDGSTYILSVMFIPKNVDPALADPAVKTVQCYEACPKNLLDIVDLIENILGKKILNIGV
jgi:hypothetical protein